MRPLSRFIVLLTAFLLALGTLGPASAANSADRQTSDVVTFDGQDVVGSARLVRTDTGVGFNLRTSGLTKGDAVSIWWVIFNNPEFCEHGEGDAACGELDLFENPEDAPFDENPPVPNEDVDPAVMAGGGHVVGASGNAGFAGHLNEGQITNEHPAFTDGPGLTDPRGAEIHLVVRTHGPVIPGLNHDMFNSFEVGCDVNDCADLQFAAFK